MTHIQRSNSSPSPEIAIPSHKNGIASWINWITIGLNLNLIVGLIPHLLNLKRSRRQSNLTSTIKQIMGQIRPDRGDQNSLNERVIRKGNETLQTSRSHSLENCGKNVTVTRTRCINRCMTEIDTPLDVQKRKLDAEKLRHQQKIDMNMRRVEDASNRFRSSVNAFNDHDMADALKKVRQSNVTLPDDLTRLNGTWMHNRSLEDRN